MAGRGPGDVGRAQCEPVHRRVVEPGHIVGARDVVGEHAPERLNERDRHRLHAGNPFEHRVRGHARVQEAAHARGPVRELPAYRLRNPRATASSALSVRRPLTFRGIFTTSAAPSTARRGSPGALLFPAFGGAFGGAFGRAGVAALAATGRRAAVETGRRGLVVGLPPELLEAVATGARRRWLARWGRLFGSRLMMSGALVAAFPGAFPGAFPAGLARAGLDWPLGGVARVAPPGVDCWSRSTVASRRHMGVGGARGRRLATRAADIPCGAYCSAARLELDTSGHRDHRVQPSNRTVQSRSLAFTGKTCPDLATFELETRINQ